MVDDQRQMADGQFMYVEQPLLSVACAIWVQLVDPKRLLEQVHRNMNFKGQAYAKKLLDLVS